MTLEQLRVFVAVAERQHVTRAAEALHLGQSAVSAAIAALEARHGIKLFNRVGRGIELTPAGAEFFSTAQALLAQAAAAERQLAELGGGVRGRLGIQASQTISSYWLPRFFAPFRRSHPAVEIGLVVGNTAQAAASVHAGTAELGFVEGAVADPALIVEEVARDRLLVLVGPRHEWAGRTRFEPAELVRSDWVLREQGSGTRSEFEQALAGFGIEPARLRVTLELPANEAVRGAVEAGLGATALSASVAAPSLEAGLLVQVPLALPDRAFSVLRHKERFLSAAARAFLAGLKEKN